MTPEKVYIEAAVFVVVLVLLIVWCVYAGGQW